MPRRRASAGAIATNALHSALFPVDSQFKELKRIEQAETVFVEIAQFQPADFFFRPRRRFPLMRSCRHRRNLRSFEASRGRLRSREADVRQTGPALCLPAGRE